MNVTNLDARQKAFLSQYVAEIDLSVRTSNCLAQIEVKRLGDLVQFTADELLRVPNLGKKSLDEIVCLFAAENLSLGFKLPTWGDIVADEWRAETSSGGHTKLPDSRAVTASSHLSSYQRAFMLQRLSEFDFSARISNFIKKARLKRVGDLAQVTPAEFLEIKSLGRASLTEIQGFLSRKGLLLGTKIPNWGDELTNSWEQELGAELEHAREDLILDLSVIDGVPVACLEDELRQFVSLVLRGAERRGNIVGRFFGFDGTGCKTLQQVADEFGLTRERVRQITSDFARRVRGKRAKTIFLAKAIEIVERKIPALESTIIGILRDAHVTKGDFDCSGLVAALKLTGRRPQFKVGKIDDIRIVGQEESLEKLPRVSPIVRSIISAFGCGHVDRVLEGVGISANDVSVRDTIIAFLNLERGIRWLDEHNEWFTLDDAKRNRLANVIRKVLSVTPRIHLAELRGAIKRVHRLQGFAPPRVILRQFCDGLRFCNVDGDCVERAAGLPIQRELGETEQCFYDVLTERGPLMHLSQFRAACVTRGMNENTFYQYLTYSPIVARLAREVYAIVGSAVPPGLVDDVQRTREHQLPRQTIVDDGWTDDGRPWITYRLNLSNLRTGVLSIPAPFQGLIAGEFFAQSSPTGSKGRITAEGNRLSGLRRAAAIRGGEEGDLLTIRFDLSSRQVELVFAEDEAIVGRGSQIEKAEARPAVLSADLSLAKCCDHQIEDVYRGEWQAISTVPTLRSVEVQVSDLLGQYALLFPCRLVPGTGWQNAWLGTPLTVEPVGWRDWTEKFPTFR